MKTTTQEERRLIRERDSLKALEQSMTPFEFQRRWVLLLRQEAQLLKRAATPSERSGLADRPATQTA